MKKMVFGLLLIFSGSLFSMEEDVSAEVFLNETDKVLSHHIAAMVVIHTSKSNFYMRNVSFMCCQKVITFPACMCKHPLPELEYKSFIKKYGQSDIRSVARALEEDNDLEAVLDTYCKRSFEARDAYSGKNIDYKQLEESVKEMLTKEQIEFFNDNFQELTDAPKLWMASRMALLEWMRHVNKEHPFFEKSAEFCDHATSYGPGVCTGLGIASCTSGNFLFGAIMVLTGISTCLNFKGHCIQDLNFNCAEYWQNKREERDLKLSAAIDSLACYTNN